VGSNPTVPTQKNHQVRAALPGGPLDWEVVSITRPSRASGEASPAILVPAGKESVAKTVGGVAVGFGGGLGMANPGPVSPMCGPVPLLSYLTRQHTADTVHNVMSVYSPRQLLLTGPDQLKAIADPTRTKILQVLDDRPASAKQLSELLDMTHGRIGHHLKVLADNGLVEVVETRQVRAMTEKFFAPTFDVLRIELSADAEVDRLAFLFAHAAREAAPSALQPFEESGRLYSARMPEERAAEFARRLIELADEFAASESDGPVFGFAGAVYLADLPGGNR
jgi:DNA-binding transcriptional ArsR family regulator